MDNLVEQKRDEDREIDNRYVRKQRERVRDDKRRKKKWKYIKPMINNSERERKPKP